MNQIEESVRIVPSVLDDHNEPPLESTESGNNPNKDSKGATFKVINELEQKSAGVKQRNSKKLTIKQHLLGMLLFSCVLTFTAIVCLVQKFIAPSLRTPGMPEKLLADVRRAHNEYRLHLEKFKKKYFITEDSINSSLKKLEDKREILKTIAPELLDPLESKYIEDARVLNYFTEHIVADSNIRNLGEDLYRYETVYRIIKAIKEEKDQKRKKETIGFARSFEMKIRKNDPRVHNVIRDRIYYLLDQLKTGSDIEIEILSFKEKKKIKRSRELVSKYENILYEINRGSALNVQKNMDTLYEIEQELEQLLPSFYHLYKN